ncbi:MAG: MFS transporter [Nitrososphaerota archaeon]|jgi:MFS family permease|nr:MFS transporter [Nitrososphaerota archaeon]
MKGNASNTRGWISRDGLLLSLSAFFADMGYQAVSAVFPILIVVELKEPAYVYGILLALSYGVGSIFSYLGGLLGNRYSKKAVSLVGNLLIPLMSISVLFPNLIFIGVLFVFGWWARYFRTPVRRAWLIEVTDPRYRSKVFGFIHALDVGGGMIAVVYSILLLLLGVGVREIILVTLLPLIVSSLCLVAAGTNQNPEYKAYVSSQQTGEHTEGSEERSRMNDFIFRALLLSATLFGFSYYALGFPIVTVTQTQHSAVLGIATFGIYLGVSAGAGYLLGSKRGQSPLRTLWSLGYLVAALSSLAIGLSFVLKSYLALYYIGAAGLGFATGSVETFEPVLTSILVKSTKLSSGMGRLSSSRALGLFVSNVVMGVIFTFSQFDSYLYAATTALLAAVILLAVEPKFRKS